MTLRKKLIEHSLPLDAINLANRTKNKAPKHYPTKLHKYWAHRPLAACRAVIFAQLVDDPSSWPDIFVGEEAQDKERRRLHRIIEDMVEWPRANAKDQQRFKRAIATARYEIVRSIARQNELTLPTADDSNAVLEFLEKHAPSVYDPFSGGGAIPLEAQRLGLKAYGSDLNPVATLITKALIEFPPRFVGLAPAHPNANRAGKSDHDLAGKRWEGARGLAEDVRLYGRWVCDEARKRIGSSYPTIELDDQTETTVVAWLWARTVPSPDPTLKGARVPLVSSFVLSSKKGKEVIAVPVRDETAPDGWRFKVKSQDISKEEMALAKKGTIGRSTGGTCFLSGANMPFDYIRKQGRKHDLGARLMAIVAEGTKGRIYLSPNISHEIAAKVERRAMPEIAVPLPHNPRNFNSPNYGLDTFDKLFTPRQLNSLACFSDLIGEVRSRALNDARKHSSLSERNDERPLSESGRGAVAYADAIATYIACALSRVAEYGCSISTWLPKDNAVRGIFSRQAIQMTWDFTEANPFAQSSGGFLSALNSSTEYLDFFDSTAQGTAFLCDAPQNNYSVPSPIFSTDPPYYDNIAYAELSDFFYVWLRRSLREVHPELFRRLATPKDAELVATPYRHGSSENAEAFFMGGMSQALRAMKRASTDAPLAIYYAFKQSEIADGDLLSPGWSSFLQAVCDAGLQVDGTWPIRTEASNRTISNDANALASSVVLVCRKRSEDSPTIARREFQRELRSTMQQALADQQEIIPLPDRRQAAIGPGIGVFSKYEKVREADDSEMSVATALAIINREIDAILAEGTEALDSETRFALEWYRQHGFAEVKGGAGSAISQLQGFNLTEGQINRSGLFRAAGGNAKLLTRQEMAVSYRQKHGKEWRPSHDDTPTTWEMAQHLARVLEAEDGGIEACGRLLAERRDAGPDVLLIAERLYDHENTHGKAAEALVWNELQQAWPAIASAADRAEADGVGPKARQEEMRL